MPRLLALAVLACVLVPIGRASVARAQFPGPPMGGPQGSPNDHEHAADEPAEPDEDATGDSADEASDEGPDVNVPTTICQAHEIHRIDVVGADHVGAEEVRHNMHLRAGVPCTDVEVTADAHALWNLGYFDDLVFEATLAGEESVDLLVRVHERPRIGAISFHGNHAIEANDLKEKVTLHDGAILALADVRESVTKLRDLYAEKGYFLARITYRLVEMPDNQVELRFDISEGEQVTVRRIRFVGNRALTDDEIAGVMQTHATGFFSFISNDNTFKRDNLDEDQGRLQALYYDRGYLTMHAGTPRIDLTPDRRHVDISIPIDEGPRIRIGRLRIVEVDADEQEIEPLFSRRELRERVHLQPDDWFSRTSIARDLLDVTRLYRDRGYARVSITPHTDVDLQRRTVSVLVTIERGALVHVERIEIRGNTKTRDLVIRRELVISEGDLYSQTLIERSKGRVQALGYFEHVDESEEEGSAPDRIVLNFEVAEKSTGTFQVGAGFSSIESFIFTAQVQQQNLFGFGQSLSLQLQLSGIRQLAQIRLVEPYLFGTDWTGAVEAYRRVLLYLNFQRESYGGSLTLGHSVLTNELRLFLQYTGEYVNITQTTGGLLYTSYGNQNVAVGLRLPLANLFRSGFTSSLRLSLTYDTRDNRLAPTRGIYASLSTEVADSVIGSQNIFVRHRAFFRWYYPLFGGVVLKMNTEAGLITSRDPAGVPIYERFFLGGILDVRGFYLRSLGPRLGIPRTVDPNPGGVAEGEPVGGNIEFYYNLEIEFPIIESVGLRGVVFTDAGNTWNLERNLCQGPRADNFFSSSDPCGTNPIDLRFSWGFGIRWFSPLGPLRFEWGIPINKLPHENPIDFEFTIGNFF